MAKNKVEFTVTIIPTDDDFDFELTKEMIVEFLPVIGDKIELGVHGEHIIGSAKVVARYMDSKGHWWVDCDMRPRDIESCRELAAAVAEYGWRVTS